MEKSSGVTEQIIASLEKFAEKLGTTIEHLYGVLVQQAPIQAIKEGMDIVLDVLMIGLGVTVIIFSYSRITIDAWWWAGVIIGGIFAIICIYSIVDSIGQIITCKKNPEYFAITEIFKKTNKEN